MLISAFTLLLTPVALAIPAVQRQDQGPVPPNATVPKVTIGGFDKHIEVVGTVNTQLGLDQYFNIPFAKPREYICLNPPERRRKEGRKVKNALK